MIIAFLIFVLFTGGMACLGLAFLDALRDTLERGELMKRND